MAHQAGSQFTGPGRAATRRAPTGRVSSRRAAIGRAPAARTVDLLVRALSRTRRRYHAAVRREDGRAAARYESQYGALERQRRTYLLRQAASREVG